MLSQDCGIYSWFRVSERMISQPLSCPRLCQPCSKPVTVRQLTQKLLLPGPLQPLFSHALCSCHNHMRNQIKHWTEVSHPHPSYISESKSKFSFCYCTKLIEQSCQMDLYEASRTIRAITSSSFPNQTKPDV